MLVSHIAQVKEMVLLHLPLKQGLKHKKAIVKLQQKNQFFYIFH